MTTKDIRLKFRQDTGKYPLLPSDCEELYLVDSLAIQEYIDYLENLVMIQLTLTKKLIPWEPIDNK